MQQTATETYIRSIDAIRQLSRICPGRNGGDIDRSTLSRWRNIAGVEATRKFNAEEMGRLIRVAGFRAQGLTYEQIANRLGTNYDQRTETPHQQHSGPRPSGFNFNVYANPYE